MSVQQLWSQAGPSQKRIAIALLVVFVVFQLSTGTAVADGYGHYGP